MLVITRTLNEEIQIGDGITVKVLRTGNQIRLGVKAPPEIKILRAELTEKPASSEPKTE